jgi:hypothetical protein
MARRSTYAHDLPAMSLVSKELFDGLRQIVINIIVARYRLLLACCRIAVDVVTRPVAHQRTARPFKLAYQLSMLHKAISFIW